MKFDLRTINLKVNSNASRRASKFSLGLNISEMPRKLPTFPVKGRNGRSKNGSIITYSKGRISKKIKSFRINYSFRLNCVSFVSNLIFIPNQSKFVSTVFLSSGMLTLLPTTNYHSLFSLRMHSELFNRYSSYLTSAIKVNPYFQIQKFTTVIRNLPKNNHVSLLEQLPYDGIKYSRSAGSASKILKMDSRTGLSLIKLPSGFTKVFSIYSLGSRGVVSPDTKITSRPNKAGYYVNLGKKPKTRGVAMNPVDHPHGGRTKSIKNPRTPWGLVAKKK